MQQEAAAPRGGRRVAALLRHGHFDRPDDMASAHLLLPLSATGREQARQAAGRLLALCEAEGLELDSTLEASQLLRAHETASLLADELGRRTGRAFRVQGRAELLERSLGACANLRLAEIEELLGQDGRLEALPPGWRRMPDFRLPVPGAESLLQAGERTAARIEASLASLDPSEPRDLLRIFVAHSGCLRHAAVSLGTLEPGAVAGLTLEHARAVTLERLGPGRWRPISGTWTKRPPETEPRA